MLAIIKNTLQKFNFISHYKEQLFYAKLIKKGDLCFDIGANLGKKSLLMLAAGGKVIAFEPQSSCSKNLVDLQKKYPDFEFHPFAVGSQNETKKLHLSAYSEIATLSENFIDNYTTAAVYWSGFEMVEVKSLDYLIETYGKPNYCKIDVEGYEFEILSHLHHTIPLIEFEFTEKFLEDTIKIIDGLADDKTTFNYILNEHLKFQLKNWVTATEIKTIIIQLSTKNLHGNLFVKHE